MKIEFVDSFRKSLRYWSIRAAGFAASCVGYVFANPDVPSQILNSLPPEARQWLSPVVGFAVFSLIWFLRMAKQAKLDGGKSNPEQNQ